MPFQSSILRALEPEDISLLYEIENDSCLWQHGGTRVPFSEYSLRVYLEQQTNDLHRDRQLRLAIVDPDASVPVRLRPAIGFADLQNYDPLHDRAEIGLVIHPSWRGKGLGVHVINSLNEYASEQFGIRVLYAIVSSKNMVVRSLFLRCDYQEVSILPSWLRVGDNREDAVLYERIL